MLPTTAHHLALIRSTVVASDNTGGAPRLGAETWSDGGKVDSTLLYVDSNGVLKGSYSYGPHAAATDVEVVQLANTGPITLRYVANETGATIERGSAVKAATSGIFEVLEATAGVTGDPLLAGVTLFDLPDESACWVAKSGTVPAQIDAAVNVGDLLVQTTSGEFTNTNATAANATATAAETTLATGVSLVTLMSGKFL